MKDVCKTLMPPSSTYEIRLVLRLWPTELTINRDHLLIKDYVSTNIPFDRHTDIFKAICPSFFKQSITRKLTQRGPRWGACHFDLDLWPFDPKIYRCLPFFILHLCMKYKVCRSNTIQVIALQRSVDRRTDGRTDRQSDYYRTPASSMAGP